MRIALVTQEEPFYLPPALDAFCRKRQKDIVAMIVLSAFNESLKDTAKRLHNFYGTIDFLRIAGKFVYAKIAHYANNIQPITRPYSVKDVAKRHSISIYKPAKINAPDFVNTLRNEICPDLIVSIAASQILKQNVLELPKLGCINLHSAPLPRYQGMMPNFWTLLHNEPEATVTVHYMVEKLDAGDIILQKQVPINSTDSLHDLMVRSKEIGIHSVLKAIEKIESGTVTTKKMDMTDASYFSFPTRTDAHRLRAQGRRLL